MLKFIQEHLNDFRAFLKSTDFSRAILLGFALTLPVVLGIVFDELQIGIVITVGALLASPSDTSGNIRNKITGILLSALLAVTMSIIGGSLQFSPWIMFPIIGVLIFGISYISIFGFRASLISFSGLFALVLSFSPVSGDMPPVERAMFIGIGGLWYAAMAILWHYIFPKGPTEFYLSQTFNLTAEYLRIRGKLISEKENRSELFKRLLQVQTEITETHETLRDILISRRTDSGRSVYEGKRLLIFAQLIDILELAMANPVNYAKTDQIFERHPKYLAHFQDLLFAMANRLDACGEAVFNIKALPNDTVLQTCLMDIKNELSQVAPELSEEENKELLMLRNLFKYQSEQVKKIQKIEWLFRERDKSRIRFITNEEARRFLTRETYNIEVFIENFNFNSSIFKHSLRLAVVAIIGYAVGIVFEVQNSYWILLTLIVIMRPNFGLTKQRSMERTIGTLIGGALAVIIVLLIKNPWVYGILSIVTLVISFAMIQRNYRAAATFITLSVVFSFALLNPNIFDVIKYRVMDTVIGTGLAIVGNLILWPAWEIRSIQKTLLETLKANRNYFCEIVEYYQKKEDSHEYKIARKQAFLKMSNLNSAFQRMTQEPKSQQKNLDKFYQLVELNHNFLASLASLGTYILNNPTTPASENFNKIAAEITENLERCENILNEKAHLNEAIENQAAAILEATFGRNYILSDYDTQIDEDFHLRMEEAHLVGEQLQWLLAMSEKMQKLLLETPI